MRRDALIAYDIASNRRRRRVLYLLRRWRIDGQLSVHECRLSAAEAEELFLQLMTLLDPLADRLLLAFTATAQRRGLGHGAVSTRLRLFR